MFNYDDFKERLIQSAQLAESEGLCKHKTGNFSLRIPGEELILITPSGRMRKGLEPPDIIVADLEGNIKENVKLHKPSIELTMHIALYMARPDIGAVVHTHSTYATAFAVKGIKISPILSESEFYGGNVELVPHAEPGSTQLAKYAALSIKKADVCLLSNHGVLTVADNIENALLKAVYVEETAKVEAISKTL